MDGSQAMRALKVLGWIALNLISFVVPIWVASQVVKEEQAWFAAQPYFPDLHDTPPGLFFGAALIAWLAVLLVVNLVLLAVCWWRRKRAKALQIVGGGA
ncbi:hypothetical protein [Xenophilus sp. Marseille-Q4582]|uniref:hypothetical protein n=1 Tax=Xenophilus sp. Marseille-Q4582 TaxID=2866600 RepID=UPI001CE491D5|nr:hypothetical protein [Xenophilus sp. Marseille-Q4582]